MSFVYGTLMNLVLLLMLEMIWFKIFAGSFFGDQLKTLGRLGASGEWNILYAPAFFVYFLMALSLQIFIFKAFGSESRTTQVLYAAVLGLCIYGVFEFTNVSVLKNYPWPMVWVDTLWGVSLFSMVTLISSFLRERMGLL